VQHPIVGIDLGTTFSLIGAMRDGVPRLFRSSSGTTLFPSAVFRDHDGAFFVGAAARTRAVLAPAQAALFFKRDMGTRKTVMLGKPFSPEELSALVLRGLKEVAEQALGHPVQRAVISVPAYFGESQRQATRAAAEIAGLEVVRLINEPTAAAIAYGVSRIDRDLKVAVLDLGGGTFDVTLLEMTAGVIEIQSSAGDLFLGGLDFDREIVRWIRETSRAQDCDWIDDEAADARLLEIAERAKKALSDQEKVPVLVADLKTKGGRVRSLQLELTRTQAELAWAGLADRLLKPVHQAFTDAGWSPQDIDEVVLVGGSSRIPLVSRVFADLFGRAPLQPLPPDEAVALGAVLTAGLMENDTALEEVVVTDIAPFTMGTSVGQKNGDVIVTGIYHPVIERGTVIPCSRRTMIQPLQKLQTTLSIDIYQGEHALSEHNTLLGKLQVNGIPPDEPLVEVRYTYDLNGLLEVEATVVATGAKVTTLIQQGGRHMDPQELKRAQAEMQKYKLHPEDKMENSTLMAQAEVVYRDSVGAVRAEVGELITAFRLALESQDEKRITEARLELTSKLEDVW
jgi:molecular chaperone HscC